MFYKDINDSSLMESLNIEDPSKQLKGTLLNKRKT